MAQQTFESGAVRDADVAGSKGGEYPSRFDLITPIGLRRLAKTYGEGSKKYGDFNWRKGMPVSSLINHALAHINEYLTGDVSEDHIAHAAWNLFAIMHFSETRPDLMDLLVSDYAAKHAPKDAFVAKHGRAKHRKAKTQAK